MLTPSIKSKVASLWDKFWSGGISNPLNAIEQITYLLFMKQLEETDKNKVNNAEILDDSYLSIFSGKYFPPGVDITDANNAIDKETLRWSNFTTLSGDEMLIHVQTKAFPFIKQLDDENSFFTKHMANAAFLIPGGRMLTEAVRTIDEIYSELKKENRFIDAQGGKTGQFDHLIPE